MEHYIYSHIKPSDGKAFYIGVGKGNRIKNGGSGRNEDWHNVVDSEGGFLFKKLVCGLTKKKALELEGSFCNQIGYENLVNVSPEEHSRRISAAWTESRRRERAKQMAEISKTYRAHAIEYLGVDYVSIREAHRATGHNRNKISKECIRK